MIRAGPDDPTLDFGPAPPTGAPEPPRARARRLTVGIAGALVLGVGAAGGLWFTWHERVAPPGVSWSADRAEAIVTGPGGARRYRLGISGDQLVLGDWDCDGEDGPALYRPSTGEAFVFDRWSDGSPPARVEHLQAGAEVGVVTDGHGCDHLVARESGSPQQSSRSRSS